MDARLEKSMQELKEFMTKRYAKRGKAQKEPEEVRCAKCKIRVEEEEDWIDWLYSDDRASKKYCKPCYEWIVDHWSEDQDDEQF